MRFFRAFSEPFSLPTFLRANLSVVPGKPSPLLSQPIFKLSLAGEHSGLNVYFMSNQRIYARQMFHKHVDCPVNFNTNQWLDWRWTHSCWHLQCQRWTSSLYFSSSEVEIWNLKDPCCKLSSKHCWQLIRAGLLIIIDHKQITIKSLSKGDKSRLGQHPAHKVKLHWRIFVF